MKKTTFNYTLTLEGSDIDVKAARQLKKGDKLSVKRMDDSLDTYEIVISAANGKELDMLSYEESVGLAPFIDSGSVNITEAVVSDVRVKEGASRAKDVTFVDFALSMEYDAEKLQPFCGAAEETMAFMPQDNPFFCLCLYRLLDYNMPIITQTHLNRYEFEVDMDDDTKQFFDVEWAEDEDYFFATEILFNESFTKCRVRSKIYSEETELSIPVDETAAQTMLCFVNHERIFSKENIITDCEIETE